MKRVSFVLSILCALCAMPAAAQDKKADQRGLVWKDRPSIVFGKHFSVDLKGRTLLEWRRFDPDIGEDIFHLRTARVGLKGELTKHFDWEIEREITEKDNKIKFGAWKDVAIEWKTLDAIRIKGGRLDGG